MYLSMYVCVYPQVLFGPEQIERLYPSPEAPWFSRVREVIRGEPGFPGFVDAIGLEATLHPGDALLIPM